MDESFLSGQAWKSVMERMDTRAAF